MSRDRSLRLLRGTAAASIATLVSLSGHVLGGGDMPALLGILLPWVLSLAVCITLAGEGLALLRTSLAVISSQALFHLLFRIGAPTDAVSSASASSAHGSHTMQGMQGMQGMLGAEGSGTMTGHASSMHGAAGVSTPMLLGHLVAAVLTIVILRHGEATLLRASAIVRQALLRLRVPMPRLRAVPPVAPRALPRETRTLPLRRVLDDAGSVMRRRGPPAVVPA